MNKTFNTLVIGTLATVFCGTADCLAHPAQGRGPAWEAVRIEPQPVRQDYGQANHREVRPEHRDGRREGQGWHREGGFGGRHEGGFGGRVEGGFGGGHEGGFGGRVEGGFGGGERHPGRGYNQGQPRREGMRGGREQRPQQGGYREPVTPQELSGMAKLLNFIGLRR